MDELVMPEALARAGVEGEEAVAEQVRATAVGAVEVVLGAGGGRVEDAALGIDGEFTPDVGAADALICILGPGVVPELTGPRHGVEAPDELAGADIEGANVAGGDIEGANVAGGGAVTLIGGRAEDEEIFENFSRRGGLDEADGGGVAVETELEIDFAAIAEIGDGLAGACIERAQGVVGAVEQAALFTVFAGPIVDAAVGDDGSAGLGRVGPEFLSRGGVEGDDGIAAR